MQLPSGFLFCFVFYLDLDLLTERQYPILECEAPDLLVFCPKVTWLEGFLGWGGEGVGKGKVGWVEKLPSMTRWLIG